MINPRDITQRLFGCVGLSFILHTALGLLILFLPSQVIRKPLELTEAVMIDDSEVGPAFGNPNSASETLGAGDTLSTKPVEPVAPPSSTSAATMPAPPPESVVPAPQPVPEKPVTQKAESIPVPAPAPVAQAKPEVLAKKKPVQEVPKVAKISKPKIKAAPVKAPKAAPAKLALDPETINEDTEKADLYEEQAKNAEALEEKIEPVRKSQEDDAISEQQANDNLLSKNDAEDVKPEPVASVPAQSQAQAPVQAKPEPVAAAATPAPQAAPVASGANPALTSSGNHGQAAGLGDQAGAAAPGGIRNADSLAAAPGNRSPIYPERDRLMKNEGSVKILAYVNGDGSVSNVKLQQGSKSKSLDEAALSTFKKWRFQPGQETWTMKEFVFRLNGDVEELPARLRR